MSDKLATYTFLPWLKQGIANKINTPVGDALRPTIDVELKDYSSPGRWRNGRSNCQSTD